MRKNSIAVFILIYILLFPSLGDSGAYISYHEWNMLSKTSKLFYIGGYVAGYDDGMTNLNILIFIRNNECGKLSTEIYHDYIGGVDNSNINGNMILSALENIYDIPKNRKINVNYLIKYVFEYYYNVNYNEKQKEIRLDQLRKIDNKTTKKPPTDK